MWAAAAVAVALFAYLASQDLILMDTGGPGIVPFELAGSEDRALEILSDWGERGEAAARRSLIADYPYLVAYSLFLALACGFAAEQLGRTGSRIGWLMPAAGAFDALENAALLMTLGGNTETCPLIALVAAIPKFGLIAVGSAYALAGLLLGRKPGQA